VELVDSARFTSPRAGHLDEPIREFHIWLLHDATLMAASRRPKTESGTIKFSPFAFRPRPHHCPLAIASSMMSPGATTKRSRPFSRVKRFDHHDPISPS
jgi:hypothetical protein